MQLDIMFFVNSALLGVGLAMDAFSVSLANGLSETKMKIGKMLLIAGVFAGFQALMPMAGWVCVHTVVEYFAEFTGYIPWIALLLLGYIGSKMLIEGIRGGTDEGEARSTAALGFGTLMLQGIATSIDALSVGFTIAYYDVFMALIAALIIAAVTFAICMAGLAIGKKFGTTFANKASILGGAILILIGLEIFIKGVVCA